MTYELREDARRREKERRHLADRRAEFTRDIRALAAKSEGRRFFRWLLERGSLFRDDFQPGETGAYCAGRRSVALLVWNTLRENLDLQEMAEIVFPLESGTEETMSRDGNSEDDDVD